VSKTEARRQFTTFTRLPHSVPISCFCVSSLPLSQSCSHSVILRHSPGHFHICPQQQPHQSTPSTRIHPDCINNHGRPGQALLGLCRSLAETRRRHHRERSEGAHILTLTYLLLPTEQTKLTTSQRSTLAASPPTSARPTTRSKTASAPSRSKPKSSRKPLAMALRTKLFLPARARPSRRLRGRLLLLSMVSILFPSLRSLIY